MKKILVIEDEALILENIIETLELEGYETLGASNGVKGLQKSYHFMPDLIICDIMMPELDGYGVLLELRSDPRMALIPFIFLTARAEREDMRYGMELGADDYVTKPFMPAELLAAVKTRFEKQAAIVEQYSRKMDTLRTNIIHALPHELRTPLTGIIGGTDILVDDFEKLNDQRTLMMLKIIQKAGYRLQRLVENYLVYAQIELFSADRSTIQAMRNSRFDKPAQALTEIVSAKALDADRQDDVAIQAEDATICISPDDFRKITEELVDNALKFSEAGTRVEVKAAPNNDCYEFTVSDQGRGMTPEQIEEVGAYMQFDRRFYEQQGMGLGLIISKRLAELYGGGLNIYSEPGQGTTVKVTLPV